MFVFGCMETRFALVLTSGAETGRCSELDPGVPGWRFKGTTTEVWPGSSPPGAVSSSFLLLKPGAGAVEHSHTSSFSCSASLAK